MFYLKQFKASFMTIALSMLRKNGLLCNPGFRRFS